MLAVIYLSIGIGCVVSNESERLSYSWSEPLCLNDVVLHALTIVGWPVIPAVAIIRRVKRMR